MDTDLVNSRESTYMVKLHVSFISWFEDNQIPFSCKKEIQFVSQAIIIKFVNMLDCSLQLLEDTTQKLPFQLNSLMRKFPRIPCTKGN